MPLPPARWSALLSASIAFGCGTASSLVPPTTPSPSPVGPDSFHVAFHTTKGTFVAAFHRAWSPHGVDRVYDLARRGFWDDIRIFRVVQNFVAQFGISDHPEANRAWREQGIDDEPVVEPNRRGRISFARGGPRTRSFQLFINLQDNLRLDTIPAGGIVGYPPLGEVIDGWETVTVLNAEYGNAPSQAQDSISAQGNGYLDRSYPRLDRILKARVTKEWGRSRLLP